jgi:hypothetical protein
MLAAVEHRNQILSESALAVLVENACDSAHIPVLVARRSEMTRFSPQPMVQGG